MTKTPIEQVLEKYSFSSLSRDLLGEALTETASLSELKNEYLYYSNQAKNGPEKSRHVMQQKANALNAEIKKRETVDEEIAKKEPLKISENSDETNAEESVLNDFLKNARIKK